ncbi:MAG: methyltransferase domain-containing protein [bacterium]
MLDRNNINNYFIKKGYNPLLDPEALDNNQEDKSYQRDVYLLANQLAERFESNYIIDIGCRNIKQLEKINKKFCVLGIAAGKNSKQFREKYSEGIWIEHNIDSSEELLLPVEYLKNSVIICTDLIERLKHPEYLLYNFKKMMNHAAVVLLSTPERDLVRGLNDYGPPADKSHVREWNKEEFTYMLQDFDFNIEFIGLTFNNQVVAEKKTILSIIANNNYRFAKKDEFKVVAIITVFNEEDIISHAIKKLLDQDIYVYIVDNWSTDGSFKIIEGFKGQKNFIGLERFPQAAPASTFNLISLLQRVEELTRTIEADWFIHQDADEIRMAPWNLSLKDAIIYVDSLGFNAIDHTVVNFYPVDNNFSKGNHEEYMKYFDFGRLQGDFFQIKAWKNTGKRISLAIHGGHLVGFEGRRIFPYKFINKHYPIRSQKQGELKIFKYRKPRWNKKERERGWHMHYDHIKEGYSFIHDPENLEKYINDDDFRSRYLVEIISGVGI